MKLVYLLSGAALLAGAMTPASAGTVLIVNGSAGTSEPNTTASITTQLSTLHTEAGNVVTVSSDVPDNFASYDQVWDIRFSNVFALSAELISQYVSYLAGGGGMFVMGENSSFADRNNSIFSLISAAGGGDLGFTNVSSTQTVVDPFTGPNPVSQITYSAPGGINGTGSGEWITTNGAGAGTGVAWGVGDLSNAQAGALTTILDVNFMQTNASAESQALTRNLIGFVGAQVDPPVNGAVPEPSTWALLLLGFFGIGGMMRRRGEVQSTKVTFA